MGEETKISFKFDGKDMEYDISDPDQLKEVVNDIQLGNLHKKKEKEMAETLKNVQSKADMYDKFDQWMTGIRSGNANPELFIKTIEDSTGLKLSVKDKEDIRSGDFDNDDKVAQLFKEVKSLRDELKNTKTENYWQQKAETAHTKLSAKYDGKNGMPAYNPDDIDKFCRETGFFMTEPHEQYEKAYIIMNEKAISEVNDNIQKQKELELKRRKDYVPTGDSAALDFKEKPIDVKDKSYSQLAEEATARLKDKGVPIFIDDD